MKLEFSIHQIIKMLPHSYPFVLIDKVIDCIPNQSAIGIKNVTFNEHFFTGHFPRNPVMPGVLILESMAQTCAICSLSNIYQNIIQDKTIYFASIEQAKFRNPVIPGDVLKITVNILNQRNDFYKFACEACVNDKLSAEATITAMIKEK